MIKLINLEQVLYIHETLIKKYGGSHGTRDKNLLESAVARPAMSAFGKDAYPDTYLKAAVLLYSLIKNHPFIDGNKRTAFGGMHIFPLLNGYDLTSTSKQETTMCLDASQSKIDEHQIRIWIKKHTKKRD
jgi:death-on-curing protein